MKTMQMVLDWKPLDDMDLLKLEYETTQFLRNVYVSSGEESNMLYDEENLQNILVPWYMGLFHISCIFLHIFILDICLIILIRYNWNKV